jgi:ElaB/YqjD/DUF883 family membrane-anchored ribosome-binding protein
LRSAAAKARESTIAGDVTQHAESLADSGKDQAAQYIRTFGQAIRQSADTMRGNGLGQAGELIQRVGDQVESFAENLSSRGTRDLLRDAEQFARNNPVVFIGAALVTGFAVARFLKSAAEPAQQSYGDDYGRQDTYAGETAYAGANPYTGGANNE